MAKIDKKDKDEEAGAATATVEEPKSDASAAAKPAQEQQQVQQTLNVDDSNISAAYANFCRVSSTPEELILDLGLNPNPFAPGTTTVNVSQRIIMNHFTAKRMLSALSISLQRHEQTFGVLETDVRRRVVQQ